MIRRILSKMILLAFLLGAGFALYKILSTALEYRTGEKTYSQVQELVQLPVAPMQESLPNTSAAETSPWETAAAETTPEETREPVVYPQVDFEALSAISTDVTGWIYIPDTRINYPIMQGTDNRYYVSSLIDGTYNGAGSIFMDYHNTPDFTDRHTILYGHNMQNGTMFAGITQYRNQEFYDSHPLGLIVTPEKQLRFEIVAAYVATLADSAWQLEFVDDEDALQWVQDAMARSPFTPRYEPKPGDPLVTLSTCSYEVDNARFVVVGVLLEE